MARAIWQGSISFGLVEIPVGLFPADRSQDLGLTMLDKRDFSPIGYRRYNKSTQEEVAWGDIVRGYEYSKGEYAVVTDVELKRANPALTQTVQILQFVGQDEIDPIFYEKPYYLAPLSKKSRGYALLRDTLARTKTVGIARIAVHTREHVAVVGVRGEVIVLYLLRFADEIRDADDLPNVVDTAAMRIQPKELAMAERLIDEMREPWRPEKFKDEYTRDVMKLIEEKIASGKVHAIPREREPAAPRATGRTIDLMPLLKKSIEGTRRSESHGARETGTRSRSAHRAAARTARAPAHAGTKRGPRTPVRSRSRSTRRRA